MSLDLSTLILSIETLERSLNVAGKQMKSLNKNLQETIRAGVIQNFEVAYEQCWKYIQRWIKINGSYTDAENPRTRKDLFRMAARYGLIKDPLSWFEYNDARNVTSHTYNESQAIYANLRKEALETGRFTACRKLHHYKGLALQTSKQLAPRPRTTHLDGHNHTWE